MRTNIRRSRGSKLVSYIFLGVVIVLMVAILAGNFIIAKTTRQTIIATVTDKDIKRDKNSDKNKEAEDIYMVYTKDENGEVHVFVNKDTLYYLKWNSSNVYAEIEVGKTYEFDVYGLRIPFMSMYQNIIKVTEVHPDQQSRAEEVKQNLVEKGISSDRIIMGGL